ncbi:MAG: acylphosphatase [Dehalococcoidia bacterium]|nr:acylphosphatase [Dehalococcoidia bacterium]
MAFASEAHLTATIYGRVQGVGYRAFVEGWARALGLSGYVRNLPDGAVEVVAEGSRERLEALLERLRAGHSLARVQRVSEIWAIPTGSFQEFHVRS